LNEAVKEVLRSLLLLIEDQNAVLTIALRSGAPEDRACVLECIPGHIELAKKVSAQIEAL
jgi:hypothetical protein